MTAQSILSFITALFLISGVTNLAHAALIVSEPVPAEFVVLDEDTGLMWAQNANLAGTKMIWDTAMIWANNLSYAGYDDWRLPTTPGTSPGLINEGEMGHLYYDHGIIANSSSPFTNVGTDYYWSGTEYPPVLGLAWVFDFAGGRQTVEVISYDFYAWAVRDAAAAVPEPASLLLLGSGLVGIVALKRKSK